MKNCFNSSKQQSGYIMLGAVLAMFIISAAIVQLNSILGATVKHNKITASVENKLKLTFIQNLLITEARDIDSDNYFELPAPTVEGLVPEGFNSTSKDIYGTEVRYCAYDLGIQNFVDFHYVSDSNPDHPGEDISGVVISAGPNMQFETDCEDFYLTSNANPGGDDLVVITTENNLRYSAGTFGGWVDEGNIVRLINPNDDVGVGVDPLDKLDINGTVRIRSGVIKDANGTNRIEMLPESVTNLKDMNGTIRQQIRPEGIKIFGNEETYGKVGVGRPPNYQLDVFGDIRMNGYIYDANSTPRINISAESNTYFYDHNGDWRMEIHTNGTRMNGILDLNGHKAVRVAAPTDDYDAANKEYVDLVLASGIGAIWAGYSSSVHHANFGGIKGINTYCSRDYPGSHACTYSEILSLGEKYPYEYDVFIIDGATYTKDKSYYYAISKSGQAIATINPPDYFLCNGWTSSSSDLKTAPVMNKEGLVYFNYCRERYRLPCCK